MSKLFSSQADSYKRYRPTYPPDLYKLLYKHVPGFEHALDCGCGTGQVARELVEQFESVTAIDNSRELIERAPEHERIFYVVGDVGETGLASETADLITVAQALHWFSLEKFYREADRVLRTGGLLACWGYGLCSVDKEIDPVIYAFYDNVIGPFWPRQRIHIEQEYESLRFPYPQIHAPKISMQKDWSLEHFLGYLRSWSSTRRFIQYKGYDPVKTLAVRLKRYWGDYETRRTVSWPLFIKAGRKSESG